MTGSFTILKILWIYFRPSSKTYPKYFHKNTSIVANVAMSVQNL